MKETIKFTTPAAAMKERVAYDRNRRIKFTTREAALKEGNLFYVVGIDIFDKIVSIASIIKAFTGNVEIVVASRNDVFNGEAWFYMRNDNEVDRFDNANAYKVLVNLIDPSIKVGAFLWADNDNGTRDDVIDVNFFGYTLNTGSSEQAGSEEQGVKAWTSSGLNDMREEQAMKQGRKLARSEAELWFNEAYKRMHEKLSPDDD